MPIIKLDELDNSTRIVGFEEIIYEKLVELNEELKRMNERLDEILGEEE